MKSSTLLKTDSPYSHYHECVFLFKHIKKQLDIAMSEAINPICSLKQIPKRNKFLNISMKIILLFGLLSFYGCSKAQSPIKKYTIKKGGQYSDTPHKIVGNAVSYQIMFDSTAIYKIDSINQYDINKLFGMSACNSLHHDNSARFGWRYVNGQLEIHAYIYDMTKRFSQVIDTVKIGEWNKYQIINNGDQYVFTLKNNIFIYNKSNKCKSKYNIALWPYFGGNIKAPHEMYFYFKK